MTRAAHLARYDEMAVVDEFLRTSITAPRGLLITGERGIGKTTIWWEGVERARAHGMHVLTARPAQTESVLAYVSLADLLATDDLTESVKLPRSQRLAIDRMMLRDDGSTTTTDPRTAAAAFLSVIEYLSEAVPVLIAVDDLQWLDPSSAAAIAFAVRRLTGPVGVLATVRVDSGVDPDISWLALPEPSVMTRLALGSMSVGAIHALIRRHVGRSFPRPTTVRIHEVCGGNPLYAIELARAMADDPRRDINLPPTLSELVTKRVDALDAETQGVVLAASCMAVPTVELIARATEGDPAHVKRLLADAETKGIVACDGGQVSFTHPTMAAAVYAGAPTARRRAMHRKLATIMTEPELRARHLALAANDADPETVEALDTAAESARRRGAPAAAAELLELGRRLGGDTAERRIRLAGHLYAAGDTVSSRALLLESVEGLAPGPLKARGTNMLAVIHIFDDSYHAAASLLKRVLAEGLDDDALCAEMRLTLAFALLNIGDLRGAASSARDAVTHAARLGGARLHRQALGMQVMVDFMAGDGLDERRLAEALRVGDEEDSAMPVAFRPRMQQAMLLAWTGQLEEARRQMQAIRRRCIEGGEESEYLFVAFNSFQVETWRGDFTEAALVADDCAERAEMVGGDVPRLAALTMRATLAAYTGRADEARRDAREALTAGHRIGSSILAGWATNVVGFLEVSVGDYAAALSALSPLIAKLSTSPESTEIFVASFVPDLVEAQVRLGRITEAGPLIDLLESNGRRLDRPWMLAIGGRCRAMWLAARGDLDAASRVALQAVVEHDRLPMPFERARTELLVGQLERRQRRNRASEAHLRSALDTFERLGTPLWAERARLELGRANVGPHRDATLTPSEQRVAELAASGMTNRAIASALFISPKTVEANLSRIYRKLKINSRVALGNNMAQGR